MKNVKYISASAGSGKTHTLVSELTKAIAGADGYDKVAPENVILTTFTKAAASEFKEKAKSMLYKENLILEADRLDQAMMGTIHSVAAAFIQKYWYLLGLSPKLSPMAEEDVNFFRNQSLVDFATEDEIIFLDKFVDEFDIKYTYSSGNHGRNYDFWKDDLKRIVEYCQNYEIEDFGPSIEYSKSIVKSILEAEHHLKVDKEMLAELLDNIEEVNEQDESDKQESIREEIRSHRWKLQNADPQSFSYAQSVADFVGGLPKKNKIWKSIPLKEEFLDTLKNLYSTEEVCGMMNQYIDLIFDMAERWRNSYREYKDQNHLIDFSDMEEKMLYLLKHKEVREDIAATYKYVFVDEFQDCSPIQVKIFDQLSEIVSHNIWVGDSKQAIYGFRGSDTVLTNAVVEIIKDCKEKGIDGCSTNTLGTSWRSLPCVVNAANKTFTKAFDSMTEEEICLTPHRNNEPDGEIRYWLISGKKELVQNQIAANIAGMIRDRNVAPQDIAVLCRGNNDLDKISELLGKYKIPVFRGEGGKEGSHIVTLITSLLSLIVDETDEYSKALIKYLTVEGADLGAIIDEKMEYNFNSDKSVPYLNDVPLVQQLLEKKDFLKVQSIQGLVESLIIELDLYNKVNELSSDEYHDCSQILHAIIDCAQAYEDHCILLNMPCTINGFISYISEVGISTAGSPDGVQLYTFHGSKGLEWKNVVLMSSDADITNENKLISRNILGVHAIHNIKPTKKDLFPPVIISVVPDLFVDKNPANEFKTPIVGSDLFQNEKKSALEEAKRLMYVAMTRPRDNLIFALSEKPWQSTTLKYFEGMGFDTSYFEPGKTCDLMNAGYLVEYEENVEDTEDESLIYNNKNDYWCNELKKGDKQNPLLRDLQPSSIPGGKVKADVVAEINPITVEGKYNSAALGTCIHDIFCVAGKKSDSEIADMITAYGFEKNILKGDEVKKSWEGLTRCLQETFGNANKEYHELSFKQLLDTQQIVTGSMDFVWETDKGCVVVDFKTFPGKKEELLDSMSEYYVGKYKGQLECYEKSLSAAGKKVVAKVLFYPVVGVIVRME